MYIAILLLILTFQLGALEPVILAYYDKTAAMRPAGKGRPTFTINKIPRALLTDLALAFLDLESIQEVDKEAILALRKLKDKSPALNLFFSIGGWRYNDPKDPIGATTYKRFSNRVSSKESRTQFVDQLVSFAKEWGFDGIDIDWEYPADLMRGGKEEDSANFLLFLKELRQAKLLLSAAFPAAVPSGLPKKFQKDPQKYYQWIKECSNYLDRVHLMAYDYHTPFDEPKFTGVNAPLNRDFSLSSHLFVARSIDNYLENGVPKEKIILGIPLFGHGFKGVSQIMPGATFEEATPPTPITKTPGFLAYFEIADLIAEKRFALIAEPVTNTATAYSNVDKTWISFDTPETITKKAALAFEKKLGGIFFWSIDLDEYEWAQFPNITAGLRSLKLSP